MWNFWWSVIVHTAFVGSPDHTKSCSAFMAGCSKLTLGVHRRALWEYHSPSISTMHERVPLIGEHHSSASTPLIHLAIELPFGQTFSNSWRVCLKHSTYGIGDLRYYKHGYRLLAAWQEYYSLRGIENWKSKARLEKTVGWDVGGAEKVKQLGTSEAATLARSGAEASMRLDMRGGKANRTGAGRVTSRKSVRPPH